MKKKAANGIGTISAYLDQSLQNRLDIGIAHGSGLPAMKSRAEVMHRMQREQEEARLMAVADPTRHLKEKYRRSFIQFRLHSYSLPVTLQQNNLPFTKPYYMH